MDGLKPGRGNYTHRPHARQSTHVVKNQSKSQVKERHAGEKYWLVRSIGKVASKRKQDLWGRFKQTEFAKWPDKSKLRRLYAWLVLILLIATIIVGILQPLINNTVYKVTPATRGILPQPSAHLAKSLKLNVKEGVFVYNEGYKPATATTDLRMEGNGNPRFSASLSQDPKKGITVTDPVNGIDFTLTPKYKLGTGKQDQNQVMYPLGRANGFLVYTAQIASVKEDIALESAPRDDKMTFEYELGLGDDLEARLEKNGSIGIYGSSLPLYGNVATGSDKDAELLQKAKENAKKDKFLFGIPAPVVKEAGKEGTSVSTKFELDGKSLTVVAENLKQANYPLTIDPSVYIQSAAQLMYGNNETNVEFDVATEQFKKGTTTGARIDRWTDVGAMNDSTYDQGTAVAGGYVYRAGGKSGKIMPRIVDQMVSSDNVNDTNFTMNMPATRPAGDLYIAVIGTQGSNVAPPAGGGWTEYADTGNRAAVYYKVGANVSGGNEASSYTWTTSLNQLNAGVIFRIKDFASTNFLTVAASVATSSGIPQYPSITASTEGSLILSAAGFTNDVPSTISYSPAGYSDAASGHSSGIPGGGAGFVVSTLDSPPRSGVATTAQSLPTSAEVNDNYTAITISINGNSGTNTMQSSVQWAHLNSTTGAIDSPAPGSNAAACSNWCTNSVYDLPTSPAVTPSITNGAGLVGMSLVTYNGYLYAIGGYDGTYLKSTVYIAKLGANGEPSLWHPSDSNQANWTYWYKDSGLNGGSSGARAYQAAYAYNGKMYILGGDSNNTANSGAMSIVEIADILPNGTLGTWSSGQSLTGGARYGASVVGYNGYIYIIGGNENGTMLDKVQYSRLNSDGTMNSWQTAAVDGASTFAKPNGEAGRASMGGTMTGIWGGYIYLAGGCTVVNGSGLCTTIASDVQLASINADGSLDSWNTMANIHHQRFGSSFIAWQDNLYRFGGCSRQDTSTGDCYATHIGIQYGPINQDGDASTVSVSRPYPTAGEHCSGTTDPYDCSLPPAGDNAGQIGQMLSGTAVMNGFLYVIGGCNTFDTGGTGGSNDDCASGTAASGNVAYVAIASDGTLKRPPACDGTTYGSWCVDSTNRVNTTTGVAAPGIAIFGGTIYVIGGLSGAGNVTSVFRNTPGADGSFSSGWTSQTFANLGVTTAVSYTFAYARANPSSATYPGNIYIFGGCGASSGAGCTQYQTEVWKCNILATGALEEANANDCDTAGQLQIDSEAGGGGQGLGIHAGAVYANYIYLVGGVSPNQVDRKTILYAKFDNSNNVVAASGSVWTESSVQMNTGRRRGTAFGYNGYLYAVGGYEATVGSPLDTIEFAKINVTDGSLISTNPADSTKFTQSAVTINQRWGLALAVSNSYAYVIGGCSAGASPNLCTSFDSSVQTFQVYNNDSGAPGGYTTSANLYGTDTNRIGVSSAVYNGYIYVAGGFTSTTENTTPTTSVMYAPIDANGVVGSWSTGGSLPTALAWGQLEAVGGSLYYIGGQTGADSTAVSTVYYTDSISAGNPSWHGTAASGGIGDTAGQAATPRTQLSTAVWNNRIYVTGGYTGSAMSNHVYISPQLSSGGNIAADSWTGGSGSGFNVARSGAVAIAYANNLYILGGYDGTLYLSDVQFTQINSDGSLDSWSYTTNLPRPIRQGDGFASNGYMYLFGGRSSANDCTSRTLVAPISANTTVASGNNPTGIGEWYQTNRTYDGGRYGAAAVNYQGKAYVLGGGCQGIVMQDDFDDTSAPYYDASMWSNVTGMTAGTACQSISTTKTFYLTTGGGTNQAATKVVNVPSGGTVFFKLYVPVADTGTCYKGESTASFLGNIDDDVELQYCTAACGTWTRIGGVYPFASQDPLRSYAVTIPGGAFTSTTKFRWIMPNGAANDSFAIEDVSVVATGNTTISFATSNRVTQTALLSQPQVAIYSRLVDAGNDAFPRKFLLNGLDNSIGARWQMAYRSMNDSTNTANPCGGSVMTGFGALTNFGDVTLGTPGTYTMKNGAGTDIGCGRYFFMTVSIDASQTYGYPDDISRGPTLDNLTLFYNSNPGKRLIHGKTYTEGIQQPLDTQPE